MTGDSVFAFRGVRGVRVVVATAGLIAASTMAQDAVWSELPPLPQAVSNNAVTSVDGGDGTTVFYSFMGIRNPFNASTVTAASHRLTFPGGAWEPIADAPLLNGRARVGANAITVAGAVYLLGGYTVGGGPEVTDHRLFRYDPTSDTYVQLPDVPVEVDDTVTGVYLDRYLYVVSGWHGPIFNNVPNVQVYDTQTNVWSQATPIPGPPPGLFGHTGTIIGDRIIYMDGVRSVAGFPISDCVFVGRIDSLGIGSVTSIAWTEVAVHPGAPTYRAAGAQGGPNGRMLINGGTDNPYNISGIGYNGVPSQPLDQLLDYDPLTDEWNVLATTGDHEPTMDHRGLVRFGACWATVGGMVAPGMTTNRVYRLTPSEAIQPGDFNCDVEVTLPDFAAFQLCLTGPDAGPVAPGCDPGDLDGDGDVDFADFGALQRALTLP